MNALNGEKTKRTIALACTALLFAAGIVHAETDKEIQEKALKAREQNQMGDMDHSAHASPAPVPGKFRGVFYGYLPCHEENCNGIKMTLSLNAKNSYLLVIQPAKPQNRETFEKGKYDWDDAKGLVVLTPNKDAPQRRLAIKDEGSLLYLDSSGAQLQGEQDRYLLQRSDKSDNREMHIH